MSYPTPLLTTQPQPQLKPQPQLNPPESNRQMIWWPGFGPEIAAQLCPNNKTENQGCGGNPFCPNPSLTQTQERYCGNCNCTRNQAIGYAYCCACAVASVFLSTAIPTSGTSYATSLSMPPLQTMTSNFVGGAAALGACVCCKNESPTTASR